MEKKKSENENVAVVGDSPFEVIGVIAVFILSCIGAGTIINALVK